MPISTTPLSCMRLYRQTKAHSLPQRFYNLHNPQTPNLFFFCKQMKHIVLPYIQNILVYINIIFSKPWTGLCYEFLTTGPELQLKTNPWLCNTHNFNVNNVRSRTGSSLLRTEQAERHFHGTTYFGVYRGKENSTGSSAVQGTRWSECAVMHPTSLSERTSITNNFIVK